MKLFLIALNLLSLFCAINADEVTPKAKSAPLNLFYDGKETWLELTRGLPFSVDLYEVKDSRKVKVATIPLAVNASNVEGHQTKKSNSDIRNSLSISFSGDMSGTSAKASSAKLDFQIAINLNSSKWELTDVNVAITGDRVANCSENCHFDISNPLNVAEKPGYTNNPADAVCANGYKTCAPIQLCWTCNSQEMKPSLKNESSGNTIVAGLTIPGMKLQPFLNQGTNNNTKPRFGFNWDCDPLISIGLWQSILVTLFLAFLLYFAIQVNVSIWGPSRFDDPKGPAISVPLTDN